MDASVEAVQLSVALPPLVGPLKKSTAGSVMITLNSAGAAGVRSTDTASEGGPFPAVFTARTWNRYWALDVSVMSNPVVSAPLFFTVFQAAFSRLSVSE